MKTGTVAQMMGRDNATIANWTKRSEFEPFFSQGAMGRNGHRDYSDSDVLVINTIRALQAEGLSWIDIATRLKAGERVLEFPPSSAGVEGITPVQVYAQGLVASAELEAADRRITELQEKLEESEKQIEMLRRQHAEEIKEINKERRESELEMGIRLGKLMEKVEGLQEQLRKLQGE
jgi:DNA-binding transcriptional MerR regulator